MEKLQGAHNKFTEEVSMKVVLVRAAMVQWERPLLAGLNLAACQQVLDRLHGHFAFLPSPGGRDLPRPLRALATLLPRQR